MRLRRGHGADFRAVPPMLSGFRFAHGGSGWFRPCRGIISGAASAPDLAETAGAACPSRIGLRPSGQRHPPPSIVRWPRDVGQTRQPSGPAPAAIKAERAMPEPGNPAGDGEFEAVPIAAASPGNQAVCGKSRCTMGRAGCGSVVAVGLFQKEGAVGVHREEWTRGRCLCRRIRHHARTIFERNHGVDTQNRKSAAKVPDSSLASWGWPVAPGRLCPDLCPTFMHRGCCEGGHNHCR